MPERTFHVPIFLRIESKGKRTDRTLLLTEGRARIDLPEEIDWVVVNAGGHGFYRVCYSGALMSALKNGLQTNLLPVERFNLINDSWATTWA
jgi:puromycin-sensitive aminopeptidase